MVLLVSFPFISISVQVPPGLGLSMFYYSGASLFHTLSEKLPWLFFQINFRVNLPNSGGRELFRIFIEVAVNL